MKKNETRRIYNECSARDQLFLKAVIEMLVAIYCTAKEAEKKG